MPAPQLSQKTHSPKDWKNSKRKNRGARKPKSVESVLHRRAKTNSRLHRLLLSGVIIGAVVAFAIGVGFFVWVARDLPNPDRLEERVLAQSTKIFDRTGEHLLYEIHGDKNRRLIGLEDIPQYAIDAFIATEDKNFYEHKGFSLWAIFRTAVTNVLRNQKAGASTLTQQFVKNAILTTEKTYTRKLKEALLAYQIEKKFSKEQILKLYFNEIPFGSTAYGIESAAQIYFAKSARDLTLAESAILAAMVKAPTYYFPYGNNVEDLINRQHFVLNEMVKEGFLTEEQAEAAKNEELQFKRSIANIEAPHFVLYVKEQLVELYGERTVEQGGLNVYTTLDYDMYQKAVDAIETHSQTNQETWDATNASLVAVDTKTGQILVMIGSRDYFNDEIDGQVNVALRPRQPGSSFKPIVYATAFQRGYLPQSVVYDVETVFTTETGKNYEPRNYDLKEHGPVSLRSALQGSLNIAAVKLLYLTGVDTVLDTAEKLGYTTLSDRSRFGLSLVLGGGEVTLLEHVLAYATLAREGEHHPAMSILRITNSSGEVFEEFEQAEGEKVMDTEAVRMLTNVLTDDEARAYAFGRGSLLTLPDRPVAAKTGTTNDYRDAWTIGYTPSIAVGVWVGNNDNSVMKNAGGYRVAAPIWNTFMRSILVGGPVETFRDPQPVEVSKPLLDGSTGSETKIKIDTVSGKRATEFTPEHLIEEKTYQQIHSILHYVDRLNPRGPIPSNPTTDPQYDNWEAGIVDWAQRNEIEINQTPPTEYDDVHTANTQPFIVLSQPFDNQIITNNTLTIMLTWETSQTFAGLEIYIDDILQQTITTAPDRTSTYSIPLNALGVGTHSVKVVLRDSVGNVGLDFAIFEKQ